MIQNDKIFLIFIISTVYIIKFMKRTDLVI